MQINDQRDYMKKYLTTKKGIAGKALIILVTTTISVILAALSFTGCAKEEKGLEKVSLRLSWITQSEFAGFYVALDKGFYKDEGIDCTIHPGGMDFNPIKLVASGSDNFGIFGADAIIIARSKEIPLVGLAALFQKNVLCFFSLKKSGITKPEDFVGKKVGVKYGTTLEVVYRAMLAKLGIDAKKIEEVPVQFDMSPLFGGRVDVWPGIVTNEPVIAEEKGYEVNVIYPADYGIPFYTNVIFTTEKLIEENPRLVERFLRASLKGWEHALKDPEQGIKTVMKFNEKLSYDHEIKMLNASIPFMKLEGKELGWMESEKWKAIYHLLRDQKMVKKPVETDEVYNVVFLNRIYGKR